MRGFEVPQACGRRSLPRASPEICGRRPGPILTAPFRNRRRAILPGARTVASLHVREAERLRILDELEILDTPAEDVCDRIAYIAAQVCGCPISLVNFID